MEAFSLYLSKLSDYIILIAAVVSALYVIAKPILSAKGIFKKREKEKFQKQFNAEFDRRAPGCSNQIQLLAEIKELSLKYPLIKDNVFNALVDDKRHNLIKKPLESSDKK